MQVNNRFEISIVMFSSSVQRWAQSSLLIIESVEKRLHLQTKYSVAVVTDLDFSSSLCVTVVITDDISAVCHSVYFTWIVSWRFPSQRWYVIKCNVSLYHWRALCLFVQKLQDFHSLSCPGFTGDTFSSDITSEPPQNAIIHQSDGSWTGGLTSGKERECLWAGLCSGRGRDVFQLGGELDIEQIERNWDVWSSDTPTIPCCWNIKGWTLQ